MAEQLSFDLPAKVVLGRNDFFVSPANALAVAMIETPATWPGGKLVLFGPPGAGKTHLTHVWADQTGGQIIAARELAESDIPELASRSVAVEDVPKIADDQDAQNCLFHLHNLVLAQGNKLLMTGQGAPNLWAMSLPDLQSRIEGAPNIALAPPDDRLLAAVLAKLFTDRQIAPKQDVIPYLVDHMDRSFQSALTIVERLDKVSLAEKRTLSRPLAARLLGERDKQS